MGVFVLGRFANLPDYARFKILHFLTILSDLIHNCCDMPLEIDFLRHFNWNPSWIQQVKTSVGEYFLPIQEKAIQAGGLFEGRNLLVVGPTSCGKGLVGDLACLQQIRRDRPGILIVPTKALARQRKEEIRSRYGPLGLHVVQSSRDNREHDPDILSGRFHFAIIVAEKLLSLLSQSPQLFALMGTVVFDELQMLFDEDRGGDMELLLTRLLCEENLQLVGLSAVIEQSEPIAEWLNASLVEETQRPIELRQGVLCEGVFHFKEFNRGCQGEEDLPEIQGDHEEDLIFAGAKYFAMRNEMTLIFCATKDESFAWADKLSISLALPPAEEAIRELDTLEDNLVTESLRRFLSSGVAVHNSDLTWPQRQLVEKYAARGDIRILCSTTTLSEGINLPIVNTFIPRTVYRSRTEDFQRGRPPRPERLTRSRFHNMTGRSGRLGQKGLPNDSEGAPFGRGILVSPHSVDIETLMRSYLGSETIRESPQLFRQNWLHSILKLIASGSARNEEAVKAFMGRSLCGFLESKQLMESVINWRENLSLFIAQLREQGFLIDSGITSIAIKDQSVLEPTSLGLLAARSGVCPATLDHFRGYIASSDQYATLEILLMVAFALEGQIFYLPVNQREWKSQRYLNESYQRLDEEGSLSHSWLHCLFESEDIHSRSFASALKKALLLSDWISVRPSIEIERCYRILSGHIERLADQFSWLIETLAEVAFLEGWSREESDPIQRLSCRLKAGLPDGALNLAPLYERGFHRTALLKLWGAGLDSVSRVEKLARKELVAILGRAQADLLYSQPETPSTSPDSTGAAEFPTLSSPVTQDSIHLSGQYRLELNRSRPDFIMLNGVRISVTGKEFELLWILAERPGQCISYDRILDRVWPNVIVEQHQIYHHKSKLLQKIRKTLGSLDPPFIGVVRGKGIYLEI